MPMLATTGAREGDDSGYRDQPVRDYREAMVDMSGEIATRPSYDGIDTITGTYRSETVLPGGTARGVYGRKTVVETLKVANEYLQNRYGKGTEVVVVDAFRSKDRQVSGFSRIAIGELQGKQLPDCETLYKAGLKADGTFSLVRPEREHPVYKEFVRDISAMPDIKQLAEAVEKEVSEVVTGIADIAANLRHAKKFFPNAPLTPLSMDVPLNAHNNAHAGGGAVDAFLMHRGHILNSHVPFDYVGIEAAMDFLEQPDGLALYRAKVKESPVLQEHLRSQGIITEVTENQWEFWKQAQRIMFWVMKSTGSTYFSDTACNRANNFGGENWHFEPGNQVFNPAATEYVVYTGAGYDQVQDAGNPGHTLQKLGPKTPAVWGGDAAHKMLEEKGVL
ncbi:hypothetical protein HYV58_00640 [Candidatus Peregrinibacteria bacterium]|nr:hypothetical protein [Candidatus Peregrinibacteria bacterium]